MRFERRPIGRRQDKDRDTATGEVLLVPKILIGRDKKIEAFPLGCGEQVAIGQGGPTLLPCRDHFLPARARRNGSGVP